MRAGHEVLEASDIWKIYGDGDPAVEAVRGVSLTVGRGEIVAIMGPSGCGKTTLLNCLAGMDDVSGGRLTVLGADPAKLSERKRDAFRAKHMGFVFQFYNLVPVLSAVENVELPLLCQGVRGHEARKLALQALTRVGLRERESHRPSQLSGGQQQRVALARAIVHRPSIVFADEPTGALDSQSNEWVMDLIDHINRHDGISFVIVTHNPKVAEYAGRTLFMDSGRLLSERSAAGEARSIGHSGGIP